MSLTNQVVLITGAGSGIGLNCAKAFAAEGAKIAVADINAKTAEAAAKELCDCGKTAIPIIMDVGVEADVEAGVQKCIDELGGLDIAFSNAGMQLVSPIEDFPFADWKKMMAIHADGAFLISRAAFRYMKKTGKGGKIIYMGSAHSHVASPLKSPYCFAKHGLLGLARVLAKEGAAHKIHTYVICPGFVKTPLVEKQIPEQAAALGISEEDVVKTIMLKDTIDGEFTSLEDVANCALFFAQDSGALSGQSLIVSHGWCMK